MKRLRKLFFTALVLLAVVGLVYTLTLDSSTPVTPPVSEEVPADTDEVPQVQVAPTIQTLIYRVDDTQLHFVLGDDDQWIWQDDVQFPLDDTHIRQLAEAVEALSYQRTIPFGEDTPSSHYGLDKPWGFLEATYSDGTTLRLDFGADGIDGETSYMLKDGDDTTAYVYDRAWMDIVFIPIYDMMVLPTLPTFTPEDVRWISLAGESATLLNTDDYGQSWYESDEPAIAYPDLMDAITQVKLEKCFSFTPSPEAVAICGLTEPVATVTIDYSPDGQDESTLTLFFGTLSTDANYRYVQLLDDETIYLMDEGIFQVFHASMAQQSA